jgi:hypothetical protein
LDGGEVKINSPRCGRFKAIAYLRNRPLGADLMETLVDEPTPAMLDFRRHNADAFKGLNRQRLAPEPTARYENATGKPNAEREANGHYR